MKQRCDLTPKGLPMLICLQFLTSLVDWMMLIFLQIIIFQLTGEALKIMFLVLCELSPMLLLGVWAGAVVDRMKLNRVLLWSCSARLLVSFTLMIPAVRGEPGLLYAIAALGAACNRFFAPAASALLPRMASEDVLQRNNAFIMGVRMGGMAAGTILAGTLASRYSPDVIAIIISTLLLLSGVCCMRLPAIIRSQKTQSESSIFDDLREIVTRFGNILLVPLAASALVTLALGSFEILALVYVSQTLNRAEGDVGILFGAYGLGMLGGLLLSSWKGVMPRYGQVMVASLFLMCLSIWSLAYINILIAALMMIAMAGLAEGLVLSLSLLRLYICVPDTHYARVVALLDTATAVAFLLAVLVTGVFADFVPVNLLLKYMAAMFGGILFVGIVIPWIYTSRRLIHVSTKETDDE